MKEHKIWRQTAVLTCANAITRGAGFVLRVVLSRMLGAQAMGVMTLSHSAHMLFITPVTAGLPLAVSRITARHADARALRAGRSLALRASAVLIPLWLLLAPLMAYALGDLRVKQEKAAVLSGAEQAKFYHDEVCPAMQVLRAPVDHLEMIVDGKLWPMPTYGDLLFNV